MKKLLSVLAVLSVMCGSVFAIGLTIDGNFAVPFTMGSYTTLDSKLNDSNYITSTTKTVERGIGGDVGVTVLLSKYIGVKADVGLFFPQSLTANTKTTTVVGGNATTKETSTTTEYKSDTSSTIDFNLFVGPYIAVKSAKKYTISVVPGFSLISRTTTVKSGDSSNKTNTQTYGFGAELGAVYKITKNISANFTCPVIYQFQAKSGDTTKDIKNLNVTPMAGICWKF